ncbi:POT family [Novymonas esmeraldas]|uniref:POT family n=1 Tax=Novymonas esmeraldas TaxID=1808958 RepID=A0AAW0EN11_9TRYP
MSTFLGLPGSVWAVLGIECVERLGYYAVSFSLFTYCTVMLRTGPAVANALINVIYIFIPASAFLASGVADSRVGRPRVLAVSMAVYATSLLLLCLSATPPLYSAFPLSPQWGSLALFALSLVGFSVGYGSMKVCTNPIMADCVVLHYRNAVVQLPTTDDGEDTEVTAPALAAAANIDDLSAPAAPSSPAASREDAICGTDASTGEVSKDSITPYGSTMSTKATTAAAAAAAALVEAAPNTADTHATAAAAAAPSFLEEAEVKMVLSRLFVYAYWVANVGGLVGSFVAPLLRNLESRRLERDDVEYTTGYYYSFLLAALSVGLGGVFLYACFSWLPQNAPAPNFVLVRVVSLALRNRWAVATGRARVVMVVVGDVASGPKSWLDYASATLEPVPGVVGGVGVGGGGVPASRPVILGDNDGSGGSECATPAEFDCHASTWVEDCRATLHVCKTFIALPIYWLICNQFSTNLMYQAAALDLSPSIPKELFNNINTVTMLVFLTLWDRWLLPHVLRHRVPSARLRIVVGFACMCVSMLWCAFLQGAIASRGYYVGEDSYILREGEQALSAGWLVMPYVLQGFASAFVDPTVMEAAYRDAPERMKGTVMGLYWVASSASGFLGLLLSPVMRPENATALFFSFAVAQAAVSVLFLIVNRSR